MTRLVPKLTHLVVPAGLLLAAACGQATNDDSEATTGGAPSSGGATSSGGAPSSGSAGEAGEPSTTGGTTSSGGAGEAGEPSTTGGTTSSGGAGEAGEPSTSGGTTATGGAPSSGSAGEAGEPSTTGGTTLTGGASAAGDGAGGDAGGAAGAGGATQEPPSPEVGSPVWFDESDSAIVWHSRGSDMPGFEFSEEHCSYLTRERMTAEQLQALEALVLVESDGLCPEDGWDNYLLMVYEADGSGTSYTTNGCGAEAMLPYEAMSALPLDGALGCPGD